MGCGMFFHTQVCVLLVVCGCDQACYSRFKTTRMALVGAAAAGGGELSEVDRLREELRQAQAAASTAAAGKAVVADSPE